MKNKTITIITFLILLAIPVNALIYGISNFYTNTSVNFTNLYYIDNTTGTYIVGNNQGQIFTLINPTGTLNRSLQFYSTAPYYEFTKYGNYYYLHRYNGSVGASIIERYNTTTNATAGQLFIVGFTTNNGGDRFSSFIGKYFYQLDSTSANNFQVWDITNSTRVRYDAFNFSFNKLGTDCYGQLIIPIGYDYNNDYLYFTCGSGNLVYIKSDFWQTSQMYNNNVLNETLIDNLTNPYTTTGAGMIDTQAPFKFIIVGNQTYFINASNINQILSSTYIDEYAGLICDDYGNCYNENAVCFPNNELYTGVNTSNYYCSNVSIVNNELYCYTGTGLVNGGLTYCAGGCYQTELTNAYNITYSSAVCIANATDCSNDCSVEGLTFSDTGTTYRICGFYDTDVCLDWSNSIPCSAGEYSENGFCETLNTSGYTYYSLRTFSATPDLTNSNSYDFNTIPKRANYEYNTIYANLGIDYQALPTSFYITQSCEYNTTNVLTDTTTRYVNSSNNYTYNIQSFTNGQIFIRTFPQENGTINITGQDNAEISLFNYIIDLSNTTLGVCLYNNVSLLGCETTVNYSELSSLDLTIQTSTPFTVQYYSAYLKINLNNGGYRQIFTGISNPVNTGITVKYLKVSSDNATLSNFNAFSETQITKPYKNTSWTILKSVDNSIITNPLESAFVVCSATGICNTTTAQASRIQYQHFCNYNTLGCRTLRSYYKDNLAEGNWNYQDWYICINSLGNQKVITANTKGLFDFNERTKLLMGLAIPFGLFLIGLMFALFFEKSWITYISGFFSIGLLIYYSIIGWLPAWIVILMVLTSSFIVVMLMRGLFAGKDEM